MPILDQLRRGVDTAKFKADQLMRINRVQSEIGDLRREISSVREKIANVVMELHRQGGLSSQELEDLCVAIDQLNTQIAAKEAQIVHIRAEVPPQTSSYSVQPKNPCPNCRFDVPLGAAFCPNCGNAMPQLSEHTAAEPVSEAGKCSNCGFSLPAEADFCPNCGQRVTGLAEPAGKED
jgi:predicted RNA-binding Zn-ribbon protein involved in translation (DUF1610 family)